MSRTIPSAVDSDIDGRFVIPVFFVELQFDTDPVYLHTDLGNISWTTHPTSPIPTFVGVGGLGQISQIEETTDTSSPGVKLRMQITDESAGSIFEELTTQDFYQRPCVIYFSTRDPTSGALAADPFELWRGKIDVPEITYGETESYVDLVVESEFIDGERPNGELYSHAQMQNEYSGDTGFKYIAAMANTKVTWGAKRQTSIGVIGNIGGGSSGGRNQRQY